MTKKITLLFKLQQSPETQQHLIFIEAQLLERSPTQTATELTALAGLGALRWQWHAGSGSSLQPASEQTEPFCFAFVGNQPGVSEF